MDHAIVLKFDDNSEKIINKLILNISEVTGNIYMIENNIPPHLSLTLFQYNGHINDIIDFIKNNLLIFNKCNINLNSFGTIDPKVIFLSPIKNNYLIDMNRLINNKLGKKQRNSNR